MLRMVPLVFFLVWSPTADAVDHIPWQEYTLSVNDGSGHCLDIHNSITGLQACGSDSEPVDMMGWVSQSLDVDCIAGDSRCYSIHESGDIKLIDPRYNDGAHMLDAGGGEEIAGTAHWTCVRDGTDVECWSYATYSSYIVAGAYTSIVSDGVDTYCGTTTGGTVNCWWESDVPLWSFGIGGDTLYLGTDFAWRVTPAGDVYKRDLMTGAATAVGAVSPLEPFAARGYAACRVIPGVRVACEGDAGMGPALPAGTAAMALSVSPSGDSFGAVLVHDDVDIEVVRWTNLGITLIDSLGHL